MTISGMAFLIWLIIDQPRRTIQLTCLDVTYRQLDDLIDPYLVYMSFCGCPKPALKDEQKNHWVINQVSPPKAFRVLH